MTRPSYCQDVLKPRLAHLGFGAFARAHTLFYLDTCLRQRASDWGAIAIRLNSGAKTLSRLDAKGGYTVAEADDDAHALHQIGAVIATAHPKRDGADHVLDCLAKVDVITMTITEKGYCLADGRLDRSNSQILADLATPDRPTTAIGVLVAALSRRRAAGLPGQTILSCDNLPMNGTLCETAVISFAEECDPELADWIQRECAFPCTMVDRIVPAMDAASHQMLKTLLGYHDENGIICEPFRQWVIEDRFAGPRPPWELAGAEIVPDVAPYEDMKLRMLNGAHSFLAYLGALHGYETVAECMKDPVFLAGTKRLMLDEQAQTLTGFDKDELTRYADALLQRFSNTALKHQLLQIAQDGSQKLPQRLLAPMNEAQRDGRTPYLSALGVAAWMQFCRTAKDRPDGLIDPLSRDIEMIGAQSSEAEYVEKMLKLETIFPKAFAENEHITAAISRAFDLLQRFGAGASLAATLAQETPQ